MKTMNDITLYDLMAEDLDIWVKRSKEFGYNIEIDDENGNPLLRDESVHPFATDSFADFCRRYLASYDHASNIQEVA